MRATWQFLRELFRAWSGDNASRLSAALSFYALFALAPLLILLIGIAGMVFGKQAAEGRLFVDLSGMMGQNAAMAIQSIVDASRKQGHSLLAWVAGIVTLLLGATGFFSSLKDALDAVWHATPRSGIIGTVIKEILSFALILVIAVLLMISLVAGTALSAFQGWATQFGAAAPYAFQVVELSLSFVVITVLFAMIYKLLPSTRIAWRDVWTGAAVTSFLFVVGKFAIGLYLAHSTVASVFGATGTLVALLIWIYYSAQIFLFGAEFTKIYALRRGSRNNLKTA